MTGPVPCERLNSKSPRESFLRLPTPSRKPNEQDRPATPATYGPSNSASRAKRRCAASPQHAQQSPPATCRSGSPVPGNGAAPACRPSRRAVTAPRFQRVEAEPNDGAGHRFHRVEAEPKDGAGQRRPLTAGIGQKVPFDDSSPPPMPKLPTSHSEKTLLASDPFDLSRFAEAQKELPFPKALGEIQAGRKSSCWMWYVIPSPPHMKNNREHGSCLNRKYAIRSKDEARAYLCHESCGVDLRSNYVEIMVALRNQLKTGKAARSVIGSFDEPKLKSSVLLFEEITRGEDEELNALLAEIAELMDMCLN